MKYKFDKYFCVHEEKFKEFFPDKEYDDTEVTKYVRQFAELMQVKISRSECKWVPSESGGSYRGFWS